MGVVHLAEGLEEQVPLVGRDADAAVPDAEQDLVPPLAPPLPGPGFYLHRPPVGELDGVADQVDEHLAQTDRVAQHLVRQTVGQLQVEPKPLSLRLGNEQLDRVGHAGAQIEGAVVQGKLARLHLGQVQDVVQYAQERAAGAVRGLDVLALARIAAGLLGELQHAQDAGHRGAQLVAHVGQKLALGLAGRLGRLLGPAQLLLHELSLHGDGDLVCHSLHQGKIVFAEAVPGAGAEGEGSQHPPLRHERMAGVGSYAERFHQLGARVGAVGDVLRHDATGVPGGAAADGHAVVQPLDLLGLLVADPGAGVQLQAPRLLVDHEVEEGLAVEEHHHHAAQRIHQLLRRVALQQPAGAGGQQVEAQVAPLQRGLSLDAVGNVQGHADSKATPVQQAPRRGGAEVPMPGASAATRHRQFRHYGAQVAPEQLAHLPAHRVVPGGADLPLQPEVDGGNLLAAQAGELDPAPAHLEHGAVLGEHDDRDGRILKGTAKLLLAGPKRFLGPLAHRRLALQYGVALLGLPSGGDRLLHGVQRGLAGLEQFCVGRQKLGGPLHHALFQGLVRPPEHGLRFPELPGALLDPRLQFVVGLAQRLPAELQVAEQEGGGLPDPGHHDGAVDQEGRQEEKEMSQDIGRPVDADVAGEGGVSGHGAYHGQGQGAMDARVEGVTVSGQKGYRGEQDRDDEVFAEDLEARQPLPFDKAVRKITGENGRNGKGGEDGKGAKGRGDVQFPGDEQRGGQEGEAEEVAESDPELGGEIGVVAREDTHTLIGEGVQKFQGTRRYKGKSEKQEVVVVQKPARVPGQEKHAKHDENAEKFDAGVKQEEGIEAAGIKTAESQGKQDEGARLLRLAMLFCAFRRFSHGRLADHVGSGS